MHTLLEEIEMPELSVHDFDSLTFTENCNHSNGIGDVTESYVSELYLENENGEHIEVEVEVFATWLNPSYHVDNQEIEIVAKIKHNGERLLTVEAQEVIKDVNELVEVNANLKNAIANFFQENDNAHKIMQQLGEA